MSRLPPTQSLMPSVLDRLVAGDAPSSRYTVRDLQQSVRRDLENLLNTRWPCKSWPPNLDDELAGTMVAYGIPDFSAVNFTDPKQREDFRKVLERIIRRFEPRFTSAKVTVSAPTHTDRRMHFRIEAMLRVEPVPESAVFKTAMDPATAQFVVDRAE